MSDSPERFLDVVFGEEGIGEEILDKIARHSPARRSYLSAGVMLAAPQAAMAGMSSGEFSNAYVDAVSMIQKIYPLSDTYEHVAGILLKYAIAVPVVGGAVFEDIAAELRILAASPTLAWHPGPPREPGLYWICYRGSRASILVNFGGDENDMYSDADYHIGPLVEPVPPKAD